MSERENNVADRPAPEEGGRGWPVALALVCTYAMLVALPLVRGVPPLAGGIIVTVLFTAAMLAAAALVARLRLSWRAELPGMLLAFGAWYVVAGAGEKGDTLRLFTLPAADVIFVFGCVLAGRLLSRILRERNMLLPIALVLALTDIFTVFLGPTGAILQKAPEVVERLSVKLPQMGSAAGPQGVAGLTHMATMGPGDLVFAALLFAAVVRFGLDLRSSFWWMFGIVALGLALIVGLNVPPVPVLPLMALGFLVANRGSFVLSGEEKRYLVIAFIFLIALFVGLGYLTRVLLR